MKTIKKLVSVILILNVMLFNGAFANCVNAQDERIILNAIDFLYSQGNNIGYHSERVGFISDWYIQDLLPVKVYKSNNSVEMTYQEFQKYTISVPTSGVYKISSELSANSNAQLTIRSEKSYAVCELLKTTDSGMYFNTQENLDYIYLETGNQDVWVENNYSTVVCLKKLIFEKVDDYLLSNVKYNIWADSYNSNEVHNNKTYYSNRAVKFTSEETFTYTFYAPLTGNYDISLSGRMFNSISPKIDIDSDNILITKAAADGCIYNSFYDEWTYKTADMTSVKLTKGTHIIKIKLKSYDRGNGMYFYNLNLKYYPLEYSEITLNTKDYIEDSDLYYTNHNNKFSPVKVVYGIEMVRNEFQTYSVYADYTGVYKVSASVPVVQSGENPQISIFTNKYYLSDTYENRNNLGYIYLQEGENTITLKNDGGGYFVIENIIFSPCCYASFDDISYIIEAENGYPKNEIKDVSRKILNVGNNSEFSYSIDALKEGEYYLKVCGASLTDAKLSVTIDNIEVSTYPIEFLSSDEFTYKTEVIGKVNLKKGKNNINIKTKGENFRFDYLVLENVNSDKNKIITGIKSAKYACDVYGILRDNKNYLPFDIDELVKNLYYKDIVYWQMVGNEYSDYSQIKSDVLKLVQNEKDNPKLTIYDDKGNIQSSLQNGNNSINLNTDFITVGKTIVMSVYNNKRLVSVDMKKSDGDVITFEINNITDCENCNLKMIIFNDTDDLKPYEDLGIYKEIYVSKDGNDSGLGTLESPFLTIDRALQSVSTINENMCGDIIVNIEDGDYFVDEALILDKSVEGKNGYNVILKGTGKNKPVISGGKKVENWVKDNSSPIWSADIDIDDTRTLYINDFPAIVARSKYLYRPTEQYFKSGSVYPDDGILISRTNFPSTLTGTSINLVWNLCWANQRTPVKSVTKNTRNVIFEMKQPYWYSATTHLNSFAMPFFSKNFYIENAKELLDEKGEFWFDSVHKKIYYYPYDEEDLNNSECYVGVTDGLMKICGDDKNNKVHNITIDNIAFKYGSRIDTNICGAVFYQTDALVLPTPTLWRTFNIMPAQLTVNYAKNIEIKNCDFTCLGSNAVNFDEACTLSKVTGNFFSDNSGSAIVVGNINHDDNISGDSERCSYIDVKDNYIQRCANEYHGLCGISMYYANYINIEHNEIIEMPYTGITLGWGWGSTSDNVSFNNRIAYNRVENVMNTLIDGAHIYTLGSMPNTHISNNYLSDSHDTSGGIYLDAGSSNISIRSNVVDKSYMWLNARNGVQINNILANGNFYFNEDVARYSPNVSLNENTRLDNLSDNNIAGLVVDSSGVRKEYQSMRTKKTYPLWRHSTLYSLPTSNFKKLDSNNVWLEVSDINDFYKANGSSALEIYNDGTIGNTKNGDWIEYSVNLPTTSDYTINVIGSAVNVIDPPTFNLMVDGEVKFVGGEITPKKEKEYIPSNTTIPSKIRISSGEHTIRVVFTGNPCVFGGIKLTDKK